MIRSLFAISFLAIWIQATAQITVPDYYFNDASEMAAYKTYDDANAFSLMCLMDLKDLGVEEIPVEAAYFKQFLDKLKPKLNFKKRKKLCKKIYDAIHDEYFVLYKESVSFSEIITDGFYNCATATALYALALEHYNIDYAIVTIPSHVYLVAYPGQDEIIFESTTPSSGLKQWNKESSYAVKKKLYQDKLITRSQLKDPTYVYEENSTTEVVSLKELTGLLYNNLAISLVESDKVKGFNQLYKAAGLYDNQGLKTNMEIYLFSLMDEEISELSLNKICDGFAFLQNAKSLEEPRAALRHFYSDYIDHKIKDKSNHASIRKLNDCLQSHLQDSVLLMDFNDHFYLSLINQAIEEENDDEVIRLEKHLSKETRENNQSNFVQILVSKFSKITNSDELTDTLQHYKNIKPFLIDHEGFRQLEIFTYLSSSYKYFAYDKHSKGVYYLDLFREGQFASDVRAYNVDLIGSGYGAASAYFIRVNKYKKAKELLLEGLGLAPDSIELKNKLKYLEDFEKGKY